MLEVNEKAKNEGKRERKKESNTSSYIIVSASFRLSSSRLVHEDLKQENREVARVSVNIGSLALDAVTGLCSSFCRALLLFRSFGVLFDIFLLI